LVAMERVKVGECRSLGCCTTRSLSVVFGRRHRHWQLQAYQTSAA